MLGQDNKMQYSGMSACRPSNQIGCGQIDLFLALLREIQLLDVVVPSRQIQVPFLVEVIQIFLQVDITRIALGQVRIQLNSSLPWCPE